MVLAKSAAAGFMNGVVQGESGRILGLRLYNTMNGLFFMAE